MKPQWLTNWLTRNRFNAARDRRQAIVAMERVADPVETAPTVRKVTRWGVLWRSDNRLDGKRQHIMFRDQIPAMFRTRREAREWIDAEYGYIANRKDLQTEPFGWSKPIPVRLEIGAINRSAT